jgi:galactose mutarotase-like enzyme
VPTGVQAPVPGEAAPIGRRTFDDLYALEARRVLTLTTDAHAVEVRVDRGYPFAQVWVPPGRDFVALEPMTVATNALVDGGVPMVAPGDTFTAAFALVLR